MALETLTLEIRTDYADPAKDKLAIEIMRTHAKAIQASLMLLQDSRPVMVSFMHSNMFEREQEISLADDLPEGTITLESNTTEGN